MSRGWRWGKTMRCIVTAAKKFMPEAVKEVVGDTLFLAQKLTRAVTIADEPYLDPHGKAFLTHALTQSRSYLEFGSGGSTVLAAKTTPIIVSVESDKGFLQAVEAKLRQMQLRPALAEFIHADIGMTTRWGNPLVKRPTPERVEHWGRYPTAPWAVLQREQIVPDTVLIDGRFRVACALESLAHLPPKSQSRILVDDYTSRPEYAPITEFGQLEGIHGRMAVFSQRPDFDAARCREAAVAFRKDFR